jgi:hypothetical protein
MRCHIPEDSNLLSAIMFHFLTVAYINTVHFYICFNMSPLQEMFTCSQYPIQLMILVYKLNFKFLAILKLLSAVSIT